jgi:hypothetical protein
MEPDNARLWILTQRNPGYEASIGFQPDAALLPDGISKLQLSRSHVCTCSGSYRNTESGI